MYIKKNRLIVLALLVLASLAAIPFAKNLVPTADQKITLTPTDARPTFETEDYFINENVLNGNGVFLFPIHLPGTKKITQIKIYYSDQNGTFDPCFWLAESNPSTGSSTLVDIVCPVGTTKGLTTITLTSINETITPSSGVIFGTNLRDDHTFYGAKVFYTNP